MAEQPNLEITGTTSNQRTNTGGESTALRRPTVSIIGMGRVGRAFATFLPSLGYSLVSLVFHDPWAAANPGPSWPGDPFREIVMLNSDQLDQLPPSELLLITTPDDAIEETARRVAATHNGGGQSVVLHTSGALSSQALSSLESVGFLTGSIHPLVAVQLGFESALQGAFYCVEGHDTAVSVAKQIAQDMGGESFSVNTADKALYHAAAVLASPHLVALLDLAAELLVMSGVEWPVDPQKILVRLLESTLKNLEAGGTIWALTGTFKRGDVGTVERHLEALSKGKPKPPAVALEVYKSLGMRSLKLAEESGTLSRRKAAKIRKLLKGSKPSSR